MKGDHRDLAEDADASRIGSTGKECRWAAGTRFGKKPRGPWFSGTMIPF